VLQARGEIVQALANCFLQPLITYGFHNDELEPSNFEACSLRKNKERMIRLFNHVTLVGRMTRDPDLRFTPEGTAVSNFTLAMNRPFKNGNGEYEPDFIQCIIWRKGAENTASYCKKGSLVGVTGRIQSRSYDTDDGQRVYVTEVIVDRIRFLDRKSSANTDLSDLDTVLSE
jgi:single-strand DNA-binding protein